MVELTEGPLLDPDDPEDRDLLDDEDGAPEVEWFPLPERLERVWDDPAQESPEAAPGGGDG
jgi:hypothetical protein